MGKTGKGYKVENDFCIYQKKNDDRNGLLRKWSTYRNGLIKQKF